MNGVVFDFNDECLHALKTLKEKLTTTPTVVAPNWDLPFELMCDASNHAVGAVSENLVVPWYADYVNFFIAKVVHPKKSRQQLKKFYSEVKHYYWEEPILYKHCTGQIIHRCALEDEMVSILTHGHIFHCGGHFEATRIAAKDLFPSSYNNKYILLTVNYVSKWVEAAATPTNDSKVVLNFLHKHIFTCFGMPRALISDEGSHFCNKMMDSLLACYGVHHRTALPYHPQINGQMELSNREVKSILEKAVNRSRRD
ncbi:uncharacterized protein LOC133806864 [Humulus lupulus]|uniref:uncharacterized protein LOC133806864 n=1 Tax=Humulus lupulus TaxID=3486 RepID=UPI002B416702|nr:uncharacterized protein LOC133806864 [Humulus lupulus]